MKNIELIANAIVIGGWALGLLLLAGAFIAWFLGWDVRLSAWVQWQLERAPFARSRSWRFRRGVSRHRARMAWLDPAGRVRAVRYWARVVAWGARRELAWLGRWCARQAAAATDVRYGQLRLGGVA